MPGGGYLHEMSCNHPWLVNNPWDLDPGCSGTTSGIHPGSTPDLQEIAPEATGINFFRFPVIRSDPGCQDAKKPKKLSRITFFVFRALFSVPDTFFRPGALFFDPEHFFSGIGRFPMVDPGNAGMSVFLRKRPELVNSWTFLRIPGIPGHPEFFSPEHPRNPGSRKKVRKVQNLAPPMLYIYRESALSIYIYTGGGLL